MADDDHGEAVFPLESENLLHEGTGGLAFLGVVEEESDVVHEDVALEEVVDYLRVLKIIPIFAKNN